MDLCENEPIIVFLSNSARFFQVRYSVLSEHLPGEACWRQINQ